MTAVVTPITTRTRTRKAAVKPAAAEKPTQSAADLNAATTAARASQASQINASAAGGKSATGEPKRATTPKAAAKPKTTPKPKPAPAPKAPAQPTKTEANREIASGLIAVAAEFATKCPIPAGMKRADVTAQVSKWLSYLPNCDWDSRLGERSTAGRRPTKSA